MEMNQLPTIVMIFVAVGMILGIGAIVLGNLSESSREDTVVTGENLTISTLTDTTAFSGVINTTVTLYNATADIVPAQNYTINAEGVVLCLAAMCGDGNYNIDYTYDRITSAAVASNRTIDAITPIASSWASLLITVIVLSIIMVVVIRSFGGMRR